MFEVKVVAHRHLTVARNVARGVEVIGSRDEKSSDWLRVTLGGAWL